MKQKTNWKKLTPEQEKKIVNDFNNRVDNRMYRNQILLKYKIPEAQFISIVKKNSEQSP